jgi:hypothetical protein
MRSEAQRYENYARECVRQASQADTVELREKLLDLARVWMEAAITEEEQDENSPPRATRKPKTTARNRPHAPTDHDGPKST